MTPEGLEAASKWSLIAAVVLTLLAAVVGIFALHYRTRLGAAKDAELIQFKNESAAAISAADARAGEANRGAAQANERAATLGSQSAEARAQQAEAELQLAQLRKRQEPRRLATAAFSSVLQGKPSTDIEILYQPGNNDANFLADQIYMALLDVWPPSNPLKSFPRPIPSSHSDLKALPPQLLNAIPPIQRLANSRSGISVISNKSPRAPDAPENTLVRAIAAGGLGAASSSIPEMPDGLVLILVGPKG